MVVFCESHPFLTLISDYSTGDLICSACGLVVQERIIDIQREIGTLKPDNHCYGDQGRVNTCDRFYYVEKFCCDLFDRIDSLRVERYAKEFMYEQFANSIGYEAPDIVAAIAIYFATQQTRHFLTIQLIADKLQIDPELMIKVILQSFPF